MAAIVFSMGAVGATFVGCGSVCVGRIVCCAGKSVARVNPLRGFAAMWRVVVAIGGTQIEMKDGSEQVFIHIY